MKKGFTLAEVLITLGIIGIVAALTLPSLIQKQNEKATVVKLKKIHNTLNNAYRMAINEYGTPDNWGLIDSTSTNPDDEYYASELANRDKVIDTLRPYMKEIKNCKYTDASCRLKEYQKFSLDGTISGEKMTSRLILADGTFIIATWIASAACKRSNGNSLPLKNVCGDFAVDLNGEKKPNRIGEDLFYFYITKYGIIPIGDSNDTYHMFAIDCNLKNSKVGNGYGCTAWVIYNENMDYLHCDDLSWDGKSKCK